jgi:hypothetical protein
VDQEVHATAGREAGATGSQPIGTVQAIGNRLYTNRQTALMVRKIEQYAELGNGKLIENARRTSHENDYFLNCGNVDRSSDAAGKGQFAIAAKS